MPTLSAKKKHFIRIFTDSMLDIVKQSVAKAIELCPIPAGAIVEASLGLALDYWNEQRKTATR